MLGLYSREAVARAHAARSFIAAMNSKSHASSLIGGWNFIPKWPTCQSWGSIKFAAPIGTKQSQRLEQESTGCSRS